MEEIHVASYNGWADEVARLLDLGTNANSRDERGFTALHWATFQAAVADQTQVIQLLAAAGADPNAFTDDGKSTPLIYAIQSGNRDAVAAIIQAGADVNLAADQVTPLMMAAGEGNSQIVRHLIEAGAEPKKRCGRFCAADYAEHYGYDELASTLRRLETDRPV